MFAWIKALVKDEISTEDLIAGLAAREARTGRPFFREGECPFGKYVKEHGVLARPLRGTRHDN